MCTPRHTYDLREGIEGIRDHDPNDFITKMTAYDPATRRRSSGRKRWAHSSATTRALIQYVQRVVGIVCVGQVFLEAMIIAYGDGRNGKSTLLEHNIPLPGQLRRQHLCGFPDRGLQAKREAGAG